MARSTTTADATTGKTTWMGHWLVVSAFFMSQLGRKGVKSSHRKGEEVNKSQFINTELAFGLQW